MPLEEYEKLLSMIEDLQDLADIKKRAKEPRIPFEKVKKQYIKRTGN